MKPGSGQPSALIVHTGGGLGDVLLSSPVVDTVAAAGYQVDFLARAGTAPAIAGHPKIRELLTIDSKDPPNRKEMARWASLLKERNYDICFLLWSTTRWAWTLYFSGIPRRVGQDSRLLYSFLFTHKVPIRSEAGDEDSHWTEILLDYPRTAGLKPVTPRVEYRLLPEDLQAASALLESLDFGSRKGPLIGFHSGKGLPLSPDRWPVDHFALLAQELATGLGARLVLTGGPAEVEIVNELSARLKIPHVNLAGKTNLKQLAALTRLCDVFVCPDSGPMHLAAAVGTPVVGIYALDEDFPKRWAPFGAPHRVVRPPRPACRPGCTKPTCPDFKCYRTVTPQSVTEAVRELLQEPAVTGTAEESP